MRYETINSSRTDPLAAKCEFKSLVSWPQSLKLTALPTCYKKSTVRRTVLIDRAYVDSHLFIIYTLKFSFAHNAKCLSQICKRLPID